MDQGLHMGWGGVFETLYCRDSTGWWIISPFITLKHLEKVSHHHPQMFFLINYHYKTTRFVQQGSRSKRGLFWLTAFSLTETRIITGGLVASDSIQLGENEAWWKWLWVFLLLDHRAPQVETYLFSRTKRRWTICAFSQPAVTVEDNS